VKAVVLTEGAQIELAERPVPVAAPRELLLRVAACGICGTDLHAPQMQAMFAPNVVLGHEFSGTVIAAGNRVRGFAEGDGVVVNPIAMACCECEACRRGLSNQCLAALMRTSGVARDGGMAEFVTVDQRQVHRVPTAVDIRKAAWTEPLAVAVRAVALGQLQPGASVAILGAGAIGQLVLQVALAAGAGATLIVEISEFRREIAKKCGADATATPEQASGVDRVYDAVFDCTGAPPAFSTAMGLVAPGGRVVVLGSYTEPLTLHPSAAPSKEASIVFSVVYRNHLEFASALRLLERGAVDVDALTTSVLPIERHDDAFAALRNPDRSVKVLLAPSVA
jgi:2-desacetyl-2-hydroxyethyl bacteriochlorophyllide A dehydrogenase